MHDFLNDQFVFFFDSKSKDFYQKEILDLPMHKHTIFENNSNYIIEYPSSNYL